jgi:hypothetical protein
MSERKGLSVKRESLKRNRCEHTSRAIMMSSIRNRILPLLLLSLLPSPTNAGLTIGSVSSTSTCYDALSSSSGNDNLVDKEEYVTFINILSDNYFTYPQLDGNSNEYINLPVAEFYQLPIELQMNFNKLACGGEFISCQNAYLITDGAGDGESPTDIQTIYLYEVCSNTEGAIDDAKIAAEEAEKLTVSPVADDPIASPSLQPSVGADGDVPTINPLDLSDAITYFISFKYQILVSNGLDAGSVMDPKNQMNMDLVAGMNEWSVQTCEEWKTQTSSKRGLIRGRRRLLVTTKPSSSDITNVTDIGESLNV